MWRLRNHTVSRLKSVIVCTPATVARCLNIYRTADLLPLYTRAGGNSPQTGERHPTHLHVVDIPSATCVYATSAPQHRRGWAEMECTGTQRRSVRGAHQHSFYLRHMRPLFSLASCQVKTECGPRSADHVLTNTGHERTWLAARRFFAGGLEAGQRVLGVRVKSWVGGQVTACAILLLVFHEPDSSLFPYPVPECPECIGRHQGTQWNTNTFRVGGYEMSRLRVESFP